jgi:hypothetical protein
VEFTEYTTWIDRENFIPMKIEYLGPGGDVIRRVEVQRLETIPGHPTVTASRISDLQTNGYTDLQFRYIQYDIGIPSEVFSERSLRNPPTEWLQRPDGG